MGSGHGSGQSDASERKPVFGKIHAKCKRRAPDLAIHAARGRDAPRDQRSTVSAVSPLGPRCGSGGSGVGASEAGLRGEPIFSRGIANNGHIEIEEDSEDDDEAWRQYKGYGRVMRLSEKGIKLDFCHRYVDLICK